jgi:hypothetical protein
MRSRWLSTFTIIGAVLIALGIVGLAMGQRFVFDPGQIPDGHEPWYYIIVGALMIVNGIFTPVTSGDASDDGSAKSGRASSGSKSSVGS